MPSLINASEQWLHTDCYDVVEINLSSAAELFCRNKESFFTDLGIVLKIKAESL